MCELFAMSASAPQTVRYELDLFANEGGERHRNRDGWGILFAQDRDAYLFREPDPAATSELSRMVVRDARPCKHLMAHVRRATAGKPELANTHPFDRVIGGRRHAFAHNGELPGLEDRSDTQNLIGKRIGDTDSELAFLLLLDRLGKAEATEAAARFEIFAGFAAEMRELGSANFLFFDGEHLFIHADRRRFETEDGLTEPREPGLNIRSFNAEDCGDGWTAHGASIAEISGPLHLFASVPLDSKGWQPLPRGTVMALKDGTIVSHRMS
ncbi:class II glutamine amidotransferase [Altericroceibacterium endophyticum]|uniref:Class II glutamine amidotransferase n=1 Tax=Altericroceibacterium endophyticum TaxID=1808508 RepID=A0A6I4T8J8_9SPHN|nr:class II glutamine amidotransferase [Altericroceibacterium endophyticum]MXO67008.1 class II glutamine amidotransferase [Altericroceibacterium endophyticum]